MGTYPPLDTQISFDLIFAISIWSHYDHNCGRLWIDELHTHLNEKGILILTVHGVNSLLHFLRGSDDLNHVRIVYDKLCTQGFLFIGI